ncbi:hypothetical protein [Nocardioides montaniterrae]
MQLSLKQNHNLRMVLAVGVIACLGAAIYLWFWPADKEWKAVHDLPMCTDQPSSGCLEQRTGHFDHGFVHNYFVTDGGKRYRFHDTNGHLTPRYARHLDGDDAIGYFHDGEFVGFTLSDGFGHKYWSSDSWIPPVKYIGLAALFVLLAGALLVLAQKLADKDPNAKAEFKRLMAKRR